MRITPAYEKHFPNGFFPRFRRTHALRPKSALFSYSAGKVLFTPAQEARNHHLHFEPPVKSLPMSSSTTNAAGSASQLPKRNNLSNSERAAVIHDLLADSKDGTLRHGALKATADKYNCDWRTVRLLWKMYNERKEAGVATPHQTCRRKGTAAGSASTWKNYVSDCGTFR